MKNKWHVCLELTDDPEHDCYVHRTPREEVESTLRKEFGARFVKVLLIEPI